MQIQYHLFENIIQSNLYKTTILGTTLKWSSWAGGYLIKHLYKTTIKLFLVFSHSICLNKDLQLRVLWCHSWKLKMFKLFFILNVHILRTENDYSRMNIRDHVIMIREKSFKSLIFLAVCPRDVFRNPIISLWWSVSKIKNSWLFAVNYFCEKAPS